MSNCQTGLWVFYKFVVIVRYMAHNRTFQYRPYKLIYRSVVIFFFPGGSLMQLICTPIFHVSRIWISLAFACTHGHNRKGRGHFYELKKNKEWIVANIVGEYVCNIFPGNDNLINSNWSVWEFTVWTCEIASKYLYWLEESRGPHQPTWLVVLWVSCRDTVNWDGFTNNI